MRVLSSVVRSYTVEKARRRSGRDAVVLTQLFTRDRRGNAGSGLVAQLLDALVPVFHCGVDLLDELGHLFFHFGSNSCR